jgi:hypothetical protein
MSTPSRTISSCASRLAGDGVAVLLHVGLDAVVELDAGIGELAGQHVDQPDLDRALRIGGRGGGE